MEMHIVNLDKRTRVSGLWLLPGSRLEFGNIGQANSFVHRNGGQIVDDKPKPNKPDAEKTSGATAKAGKSKPSKADVPAEPVRYDA